MATTITFTTGQENTSVGSTKANAYVLTRDGAKALRYTGTNTARVAECAAIRDKKRAIVGVWTTYTTTLDDGVYISFAVVRTKTSTGVTRRGITLLRVRENAAYRRVSVPTIGVEGAAKQEIIIEGRFDIVELDEVQALVGIPAIIRNAYDNRDTSFVTATTLEAEVEARPSIQTKEVRVNGETRRIVTRKKGRKLGIT